jgi:hypothetical protein
VPVTTNKVTRPSRLIRSLPDYLKKSAATIVRLYALYEPLKVFFYIGGIFILIGLFVRDELTYDGRRSPMGAEQASLYPDHLVIRCDSPAGEVEFAMSAASLTGFQAWLESRPPGTDWNRIQ